MHATAPHPSLVAFQGARLIASGTPAEVAAALAGLTGHAHPAGVLTFNAVTGHQVDLDLRTASALLPADADATGVPADEPTSAETNDAAPPDAQRPRGRPKLGVIAREVTLLPRHWDWLGSQPGGASAAIRRLIDHARSASSDTDRRRQAQEAAYRFMSAVLGNATGFEEATRALFASDAERFEALSESWPVDLRDHARRLATPAFPADSMTCAPSPA